MSKNIDQVFIANPITTNIGTDLMYFGQSPYGAGNDAAMTYANFSAQFLSVAGLPVTVPKGGTGIVTTTAYALITGGTTATGAFQHVSGLGTAGQVLTSNGAGTLPTWQAGGGGSFNYGLTYIIARGIY
jgi:hypothetical protein